MTAGRRRRSRPTSTCPAYDLYIEITTLNQKLVTKKNRKARRLARAAPRGRDPGALPARLPAPAREVRARAAVAARARPTTPATPRRSRFARSTARPRDAPSAERAGARALTAHEPTSAASQPARRAAPALGARMVPFGGWDMPLQYTGVLDEHRACREPRWCSTSSHLGTVECRGAGALDALQWLLTNDLGRIEPGRAQYTHLLDPDRRARRRRHHRVVGRRRALLRDAERVEHRRLLAASTTAVARATGAVDVRRRHRDAGGARGAGPEARALLAAVSADAAAVPRFAVREVRRAAWSPAPATPAKTASRSTCRGATRPRCGSDRRRRDRRPPGSAPATRCGSKPGSRCTATSSAPASRRSRPGSAGSCAGTRATSAAATRSTAERERGRRPAAARHHGRGPAPAARRCSRVLVDGARSGHGHERELLADARPRDRARVAAARRRTGALVKLDVRGQLLDGAVVKPPFVTH